MDFSIPPHIEDMRHNILNFIEAKVIPWEPEGFRYDDEAFPKCSEDHEYIRALQQEVKEMGLWAPHLPQEAGGMGLSLLEYGLINEIIGRSYYAPRVFGCNAPDSGNAEILWEFGTDEQKAAFFDPLQRGDVRSYFGMTEPDVSGSDPRQLSARAERDSDEWVINGRKWYSTNANGAAFGIVVAVTDPDESPYRRQSLIIVPSETPGVKMLRPISVMGHTTGAGHWEVEYENARVPVTNTLGEPGQGFAIAQTPAWAGAHSSLYALAGSGGACAGFDVRIRAETRGFRRAAGRQANRAKLDRRQRRRNSGRASNDPARRLENR